ncbi:MAG: HAD hydrolase family protein, partial [Eubacterium sp.]|nr:HAD hydrolase family protein [Eubacterium sp.]
MGKVIFFDVDGTLVSFGGQMSESAKEALRKARSNGHQLVICSGRSRGQIYPWLLEVCLDLILSATVA